MKVKKYEMIEKELLLGLYLGKELNQTKIAKIFGYPYRHIIGYQLEEYGISTRNNRFIKKVIIEPELLLSLYHGNQYSQTEIGKIFGVSHGCILKEMRKSEIPARPYCESNKISENSGKFKKGDIPYNKGLPPEQQSNWRGGISFEPYNIEFNKHLREYIRRRDKYICQICGKNQSKLGNKLHCHHIDYDKQNNSEINLISLCNSCHSRTNFGMKNWIKHFEDKMWKMYVHI